MEFLRNGETIWRATAAIRTFRPFVSASRPRTSHSQLLPRPIGPSQVCWACRRLSTQPVRLQQAATRASQPEPAVESSSDAPTSSSENRKLGIDEQDRAVLDDALELKHMPGVSAKHTQRFHSPRAQQAHRTPSTFVPKLRPAEPLKPPPGNSLTDALSKLSESQQSSGDSVYRNMMFPDNLSSTSPTATTLSKPPPRREIPQLRLSSRTGKTLEVLSNDPSDLSLKLKRLNMTVARNRVPQDFNKQRFHERPGLKRKRLKSQRWRARFKKGFSRIVERVGEMRRMGW